MKSNSPLCLTGLRLRETFLAGFLAALGVAVFLVVVRLVVVDFLAAFGVTDFLVVVRFLAVDFLPAFALGVTLFLVVVRFFVVGFLVALAFEAGLLRAALLLLVTFLFAIFIPPN